MVTFHFIIATAWFITACISASEIFMLGAIYCILVAHFLNCNKKGGGK